MNPGRLYHWFLAIRPKTLGIALVPVISGSVLAWAEGAQPAWAPAIAALLGALLIQIGTNLYNDAADYERGADTPARMGPRRATAQGWFTAAEVKRAAVFSFGLAFLVGTYLAWVGGWPIVVIGLCSLAAGYAYTGGPRPIAYSASGELFVFIFFGLIAVLGSYYLQAGSISFNAVLLACAIGFLAAAVLLVNNYRDLETDEQAHKLTLAHYIGRGRTRGLYALLVLTPFLLPLALRPGARHAWLLLLALPLALWLLYRFISTPAGPLFNRILALTAQLQLLYGLLLTAALLL
jgi:1,4-dihydroxy-2-naphthoate octaprenyltransferase